jgi:hypothetical protein
MRVAGSNVTTRYFHTDNLGSISLTNETGAVVEHTCYGAVKRHRDSSRQVRLKRRSVGIRNRNGLCRHSNLGSEWAGWGRRAQDPIVRNSNRSLEGIEPV